MNRDETIEFTYDGDLVKGILKIDNEEIPVCLTEGSAEKVYVTDGHYSLDTGIFLRSKTKWKRIFILEEIVR